MYEPEEGDSYAAPGATHLRTSAPTSIDESKGLLDSAFRLDFENNGPSLFRLMQTMMRRWQRYRSDVDPRVRARVKVAGTQLRTGYGAALWAMERYLRPGNPAVSERIRALRLETERECGAMAAVINRACGPLLLWSLKADARRHPSGRRLEPRTFVARRAQSINGKPLRLRAQGDF